MADYAELITELKSELSAEGSAVIGFGGSYGACLGPVFSHAWRVRRMAATWSFACVESPTE